MALILFIDTSTENALVGIEKDGVVLGVENNNLQKEHASFLHPAIESLLKINNLTINNFNAIAIANGPGSYTGLRVAMATAKGLCFALQIPLITISSLKLITQAAIFSTTEDNFFFCPMIDARRMEVFTAVYNKDLQELLHPFALILQEKSYSDILVDKDVYFFGNGSLKWKEICKNKNANFITYSAVGKAFAHLAETSFIQENFADLSLSEPEYIKGFYDGK